MTTTIGQPVVETTQAQPLSRQRIALIFSALFLVALLVFILYWLTFPPQPVRIDVLKPWGMIKGFQPFEDRHPYQYGVWLGITSFGLPSSMLAYQVASIVQFVIAALIFAGGATLLIVRRVPKWVVIPAYALLLLTPITPLWSIFIYKDIPAALFVMATIFIWLYVAGANLKPGIWTILLMILFVVVTYLAGNLRHNHKFLPFMMILLVWILRKVDWRLKAVYTVLLLLLTFLSVLPVRTGAVIASPNWRVSVIKSWVLSFSYANGSPSISEEEAEFIRSIIPDSYWDTSQNYPCRILDFDYSRDLLNEDEEVDREITRILLEEVMENPQLILAQRVCVFAHALGFGNSPLRFELQFVRESDPQKAARYTGFTDFENYSAFPELRQFITTLTRTLERPPQVLLLTHVPSLLMLFVVGVIGVCKRHIGLIGVFLVLFLLTMSIFIFSTGQRYTYLAYLHFFVFYSIPIALLPWYENPAEKHNVG